MDADSPPAKRRRTSPRLSNRGSTEPSANPQTTTTTPPDAPPTTADGDTETDETRARPPSFASPTRASLARHNPAILGRRQSAPKNGNGNGNGNGESTEGGDLQESVEAMIEEQLSQTSAEKGKQREEDVRPLSRPPVRSPVRSPSRQLSPTRPLAQPALRSPVRLSRSRSRSPTRRLFGAGNGNGENGDGGSALFGAAPQKSPEAARNRNLDGLTGSVASSVPGSLLGEPPRRSPLKPVPRPLPPPDPQRSEDLLEPLIARDKQKQRSALDKFRTAQDTEEVPPEPELPPTPENANIDTAALARSPPGIHHGSTPSKRPRKAARSAAQKGKAAASGVQKAKAGTVQSSSPLKQPPMKATDNAAETTTADDSIGNADALKEASSNVPTTRGRGRPRRKSEPARNIQQADPDARKKKEKDELQAEIDGLEADIALAAAENERIREGVEQGVPIPNLDVDKQRAIISLLRRRVLPEDDEDSNETNAGMQSTLDWLQAATNPIAFLPFGKPRTDVTELLQFGSTTADDNTTDELPPPVSHHPIEMSAAEELPFLQAFTPLAFRSEIVVLPSTDSEPLLQKHIITASSTTPPGLFLARIEMTVHSKNLKVVDLQVPKIEPPAAAAEIKPLLERLTRENNGSSALTRNVTVLTWAMGEWVRVAVRRAKFWVMLARKLKEKGDADEPGGVAGMVEDIRQLRSQQRKRRRKRADDEEEDQDDNDQPAPVSKVELLEHLGRTAMDLDLSSSPASPDTNLRVEWSIQFDWTGEAKSKIQLLVGVPGKWRKADERGRLARLPKLFDELVQDSRNPMDAVQTVVALLAGEAN